MSILYPQVDSKAWAKRYGLPDKEIPCKKCGVLQALTIPMATEEWRGLMSPIHPECGERYQIKAIVLADPKEREAWKQSVQSLSAYLGGIE